MSSLAAFARRDWLVQRSYRLALGFDLAWGVIDLVLYYFISKVVGPVPASELQGAPSYFAFAVAGILMSLVVASATADIAGRIREEQLTGTLELLVAQPLRGVQLAFGTAAFPFAYAIVRVALYTAVAIVVLDLPTGEVDPVGVVVILLLGGLAFLGLGILAAAATIVFMRGASIVDVAVFAMTFVSGAVFPLSVLPSWLEAIGSVMPTAPAYEGFRNALYGGEWGTQALILAGVAVVLIPLSVVVFDVALAHAKRRGTLSQY